MMAIDWNDVRYRGDARDVEELLTTYRVADYLETFEENRRQIDQGVRERLLKEGIRLERAPVAAHLPHLPRGVQGARARGPGRGVLPAVARDQRVRGARRPQGPAPTRSSA